MRRSGRVGQSPSKLKSVRTPSSRRIGATLPLRMVCGANMNANRLSWSDRAASSGRRRGACAGSSTSALPQALDAARLPCLATARRTPHDQRGHRRDVDRARAVAAGAAHVDDPSQAVLDLDASLAHRARRSTTSSSRSPRAATASAGRPPARARAPVHEAAHEIAAFRSLMAAPPRHHEHRRKRHSTHLTKQAKKIGSASAPPDPHRGEVRLEKAQISSR